MTKPGGGAACASVGDHLAVVVFKNNNTHLATSSRARFRARLLVAR